MKDYVESFGFLIFFIICFFVGALLVLKDFLVIGMGLLILGTIGVLWDCIFLLSSDDMFDDEKGDEKEEK